MTSKERMFAALTGKPSDVLPVAPCYFGIYLDSLTREVRAREYRARLSGHESYPVSHEEEIEIYLQALKESLSVFAESPDWLPAHLGFSRLYAKSLEIRVVDGRLAYCNRQTGALEFFLEKDEKEIEFSGPRCWDDSSQLDDKRASAKAGEKAFSDLLGEGRCDLIKAIVQAFPEKFIYGSTGSVLLHMLSCLGFGGMMVAMREKPDLFKQVEESFLKKQTDLIGAYAASGVDGIFLQECLASADCISPSDYDEFAYPIEKALVAEVNKRGVPSIFYFTGDISDRKERLKGLGPAAFHFEESKKSFKLDLEELVRDFGDRCIFGNFDAALLARCSDEQMKSELQRQVRAGRKAKGFVIGIGSPITPDTTIERVGKLVTYARQASRS